MRIELREHIKTTDEEFDSVNQNDRPTLSEELHKIGKRSAKYRAKYDSQTEDFTLYAEEFE